MKTIILSIIAISLTSCANLSEQQNDRAFDLGVKIAESLLSQGQASSIEATK